MYMRAEFFPIFQVCNIAPALPRYYQFASRLVHFFKQRDTRTLLCCSTGGQHPGRPGSYNYYMLHAVKYLKL